MTPEENTLLKWIVTGNADADIIEALKSKVPDGNHALMLQRVMHHLATVGDIDRPTVRGFCFEGFRELYRRMLEIGDFANAARALKQLYDMTK